ncbi:MAG: TatD family hydrolase [Myxococcota bacterium]
MRLFDSHAHLGAPELRPDAGEILGRAREAGVSGLIAIGAGYGLDEVEPVLELADLHADVWATAGVHPHDAKEWGEEAIRRLEGWVGRGLVGIGECGLDYWYEHSPRDQQREALRGQIRIARRHELPLVIHVRASRGERDAYQELVQIFDEEGADRVGGVIHCFTGDTTLARDCMDRGFDISFSGILTFRNADDLRDVARTLPLERLLVETDSPLLAPVPHRGRRNEPAYVLEVATCLAGLHGVTPERLGDLTTERAHARFRLGRFT